jgi:anti-sigma B factor antagonist
MATPAPPISLTVETERKPDCILVHLKGRLVSGVCSFLYNKIHALIPDTKFIVLDLTDLEWVDSMGLGTLVRLYVACKSAGVKLQLVNLAPKVRELLGLTNLLGIFAEMGEKGFTHF